MTWGNPLTRLVAAIVIGAALAAGGAIAATTVFHTQPDSASLITYGGD
jgi:hypothetical protein